MGKSAGVGARGARAAQVGELGLADHVHRRTVLLLVGADELERILVLGHGVAAVNLAVVLVVGQHRAAAHLAGLLPTGGRHRGGARRLAGAFDLRLLNHVDGRAVLLLVGSHLLEGGRVVGPRVARAQLAVVGIVGEHGLTACGCGRREESQRERK